LEGLSGPLIPYTPQVLDSVKLGVASPAVEDAPWAGYARARIKTVTREIRFITCFLA
jgi:hypothetical protein